MTKHKDAPPTPSRANGQASAAASAVSDVKKSDSANSLKNNKEIKKLIDMGVQRGYLTFIEVNELLPPEIITPDAIDDVMNLLSENEIEVIDATKRPKSDEEGDEEGDETPLVGAPAQSEE